MPTVTIKVNADGSDVWTTGSYLDIDEGTDSPNDSDYIQATSNDIGIYELENMPANFDYATSATIKIRGRKTDSKSSAANLNGLFIISNESANLIDNDSYSNPVFTTSWSTYVLTDALPQEGVSQNKTDWDGAKLYVRSNSSTRGNVQISSFQIEITYVEIPAEIYNETGSGGMLASGEAIDLRAKVIGSNDSVVIPSRGPSPNVQPHTTLNTNSIQFKGLVGCWPMLHSGGETLYDIARGNNGILTNMADPSNNWVIDGERGGYVLEFDGNNDHVLIENILSLQNLEAHTISLWFKPSDLTGTQTLIEKYNGSGDVEYNIYLDSANISSTKSSSFDSGLNATVNEWQHVVMTYDETTIKLYLNGIEGDTTSDQSYTSNNGDLALAGRPTGGLNFNGYISDVRIYNRSFTESEIYHLYDPATRWQLYSETERQIVTGSTLIVSDIYDEFGSGGCLASGSANINVDHNVTSNNGCLVNGSASNQIVITEAILGGTTAGSVAGEGGGGGSDTTTVTVNGQIDEGFITWSGTSSEGGTYENLHLLLDEGIDTPDDTDYIFIEADSYRIRLYLEDMPSDFDYATSVTIKIRGRKTVSKSDSMNLGFISVETDKDLENRLVDSASYSVPVFTTTYVNYNITGDPNESYNTKSDWDGAYIEISPDAGFGGQVQVSAIDVEIDYVTSGSIPDTATFFATFNPNVSNGSLVSGSANVSTEYNTTSNNGCLINGESTNSKSKNIIRELIVIPSRGPSPNVQPHTTLNTNSIQFKGLVGCWPMLHSGGETLYDIARGNNGVLTNMTDPSSNWIIDGERGGYVLQFDGDNDHVLIENTLSLQNLEAHTISLWFKPNDLTGTQTLIEKYNGSGDVEYNIYLNGANISSTKSSSFDSDLDATVNEWQHVVMTYDETTIKLYLNGIEGGTTSAQSYTSSNGDLAFAGRSTGGLNFNGYISDVRIYNRSFTESEIYYLYNPATRWELYQEAERQIVAYSTNINTYNEFGSGGCLTSGSANINIEYNTTSNNGCLIGGSANINIECNTTSNNGCLISGSGIISETETKVGSGGCLTSGSANISVEYNATSNNGCLVSGSGTISETETKVGSGGCLTSGTANINIEYNTTSNNGCLVSGEAIEGETETKFGSGGILNSGSANINVEYNVTSNNGCLISGSGTISETETKVGSGGCLTSGSANINIEYNTTSNNGCLISGEAIEGEIETKVGSGGILTSGTANINVEYNVTSNNGCLIGGSANINIECNTTSNNGCLISGSGTISETETKVGSGGILTSGTANINIEYNTTSNNGCLISGEAIEGETESKTGSGGIFTSGIANINVEYNAASNNGCLISGEGVEGETETKIGSGGCLINGSANINVDYNTTSNNGCLVSGEAIEGETETKVGSGGCLTSGSANINVDYNTTSNNGCLASGNSIVGSSGGNIIIEGGCLTNGSANISVEYNATSNNGCLISGSGTISETETKVGSGGCLISGSANTNIEYNTASNNGCLVSGSVNINVEYNVTSNNGCLASGNSTVGSSGGNIIIEGGVLTSGTANINVDYNTNSNNGCLISGEGVEGETETKVGSGGILTSGIANINVEYITTSNNGCLINGSANINVEYNATSNNGCLISGEAIEGETETKVGSGGCLINGSANINVEYNTTSNNGCLVSGEGTEGETETKTGSGGILTSGSANINVEYNATSNNGCLASGNSIVGSSGGNIIIEGGCLINGSANINVEYNATSNNGCLISGEAVEGETETKVGSGGCLTSGSANISVEYNATSNNGCLISGKAVEGETETKVGSGGCLINGSANINVEYNTTSNNGCLVSGESTEGETETKTGSGGCLTSGVTDINVEYNSTSSNGCLISGNSIVGSSGGNIIIEGGCLINGSANINVEYNATSNNGCLISGEVIEGETESKVGSGGILTSGIANINVEYNTTSNNGCLVSGEGVEEKIQATIVSGGCLINGSVNIGVEYNTASNNGCLISGEAAEGETEIKFGSGGCLTSGSANISVEYNTASNSGCLINCLSISHTSYNPIVADNGINVGLSNSNYIENNIFGTKGAILNSNSLIFKSTEFNSEGGVRLNPDSELNLIYNPFASTGVKTNGNSQINKTTNYEISGGSIVGRNFSDINVIYNNISFSLGIKVSGVSTITLSNEEVIGGGIKVGNNLAIVNSKFNPKTFNGLLISGDNSNTAIINIVAIGGSLVNGLAIATQSSDKFTSGGCIIGGLNETAETARVSVKISGTSIVQFINGTEFKFGFKFELEDKILIFDSNHIIVNRRKDDLGRKIYVDQNGKEFEETIILQELEKQRKFIINAVEKDNSIPNPQGGKINLNSSSRKLSNNLNKLIKNLNETENVPPIQGYKIIVKQ